MIKTKRSKVENVAYDTTRTLKFIHVIFGVKDGSYMWLWWERK